MAIQRKYIYTIKVEKHYNLHLKTLVKTLVLVKCYIYFMTWYGSYLMKSKLYSDPDILTFVISCLNEDLVRLRITTFQVPV